LIQKLLKTCATRLYGSLAQILYWRENPIEGFSTQVLMPFNYTFPPVGQTTAGISNQDEIRKNYN